MKNIFLLYFFLTSSIAGICQEIPKKANLIVFTSDSLKDFELFSVGISILKQEGYSFETIDKDFYLCSTKDIHPKGSSLNYRIDMSVINNKIEIRSYVILLSNNSANIGGVIYSTQNTWERGANRGLSSSIWRYGWDRQLSLLDKIKEVLPGAASISIETSE